MTSSDVNVIMVKLEHLSDLLDAVHEQVKATNGRVTTLEIAEARLEGNRRSRQYQSVAAMSVVSGAILAGIIWFVGNSIN